MMHDLVEHIARALLRDKGESDENIEKRGVSSYEEHNMASMFVKMHEALHSWMKPVCEDCAAVEPPAPVEVPNNPPEAQHVEEPHEEAPDTVDHAESDSVEEEPHAVEEDAEPSPVTLES